MQRAGAVSEAILGSARAVAVAAIPGGTGDPMHQYQEFGNKVALMKAATCQISREAPVATLRMASDGIRYQRPQKTFDSTNLEV